MKKLLSFLCVLTCVFALTACGSQTTLSDVENQKVQYCQQYADNIFALAQAYGTPESIEELTTNYNKQELAYFFQSLFYSQFGNSIEAEFGAFEGLLTTYTNTVDAMGGIVSTGNSTYDIKGKEITISMPLEGVNCNGTYVVTFTNDIFTKFVSAEFSAKTSISQKLSEAGKHMGNAGLNTVLGMCTVFLMLILISAIISSFNLFNGGKKKASPAKVETVSNTVEEESEELSDDTELVAVIMAAISAYEGNASTDGFVVRSIRRANRRN